MNKLELVKQFTEISERIMLHAEKGERIAVYKMLGFYMGGDAGLSRNN